MKKTCVIFVVIVLSIAPFAARAADLPTKAPPLAPAPYSWTGFYIGGNVGYGWSKHHLDIFDPTDLLLTSGATDPEGVLGGGQLGYNWQTGNWVLGIEADIQAANQRGEFDSSYTAPGGIPGSQQTTEKLDWFGTVRGRIGYAWDRNLLYATGGWAYGHEKCCNTATSVAGPVETHFSVYARNGWTVGGGYEWSFADHWSVKFEYLYIDFGSQSGGTLFSAGGGPVVYDNLKDNIVRIGLNYRIW